MYLKRVLLFLVIVLLFCQVNVFAVEEDSSSILLKPFIEALNNCSQEISDTNKVKYLLNSYTEKLEYNKQNTRRLYYKDLIYKNDNWLFLKSSEPNKDILLEIEKRSGTYKMIGRLSIPDINIDIALFNTNSQEIVDAKDSAACFKSGDTFLVADHWYSGFERIKNCKESTLAYLDTGERVYTFICTSVILGHNNGKILTDLQHNSVMYDVNEDGLTLYTCVNGWQNIRIAFFKPNNLYLPVDKLG